MQRNQDGTYAWVIRQDGTAEVRPITVATIQDDEALVTAGLASGERIVIAGQSRLRPGANVAPSMRGAQASLLETRAAEREPR